MAQKQKKAKTIKRSSSDKILLAVTIVLVALGLIMVLSASSPSSLSKTGSSYKFFKKQLLAAIAGIFAMSILSVTNYNVFRKLKWPIYIAVISMLYLVGMMGLTAGGAKRWIVIGGINFQPSEFAKIGLILFFASILTELKETKKINNLKSIGKIIVLLAIPLVAIFVLQNHFSATLIITVITAIQMFVAGVSIRYFVLGGTAGIAGLIYMLTKGGGFRTSRFQTWLDPFSDPTGKGWQIIQSLYAIGSGGIFGLGLGESKQKYLYLPEPQNDFIFSVLAEELGFFGCVIVIILFLIFIWRGIVISMKAKDTFGSLVAIGIVTLIGLEALINIAVVTGTIPVTGMPLPFFSYGGTAILVNLVAVGILLNISRNSNK